MTLLANPLSIICLLVLCVWSAHGGFSLSHNENIMAGITTEVNLMVRQSYYICHSVQVLI